MTDKKTILGLMCGTSFDGVDGALITVENGVVTHRGQSHFEPFIPEERAILRAALGTWDASPEVMNVIHNAHNRCIDKITDQFDFIGFHGQTLAHDPANGRTYQAGDPAALRASVPIIYDFRSADVAAGGEGAPLIPIYHYALAKELGFSAPVCFVNIGGVSNVTYVDPTLPPEAGLLAFDCGIGNAMGDDLIFKITGQSFDNNGEISSNGRVNQNILDQLMAHEFFAKPVPKSLDRQDFNGLADLVSPLDLPDALATINAFTVAGIRAAVNHFPRPVSQWIVAGGGRKNAAIMAGLDAKPIEDFGLNGDMTEAEGFAYLADKVLENQPISFPSTTRAPHPIVGGRIHSSTRKNNK